MCVCKEYEHNKNKEYGKKEWAKIIQTVHIPIRQKNKYMKKKYAKKECAKNNMKINTDRILIRKK